MKNLVVIKNRITRNELKEFKKISIKIMRGVTWFGDRVENKKGKKGGKNVGKEKSGRNEEISSFFFLRVPRCSSEQHTFPGTIITGSTTTTTSLVLYHR